MDKGNNRGIYHLGDSAEITIEDLVRFVGKQFQFTGSYENAPTYSGSVVEDVQTLLRLLMNLGTNPK